MDISSFFKKSCVVFLLPLLFGCSGDVDTYPEPNISVSDSSYDFGGIVLDNSSDNTFIVRNTGNEPLSIGSISSPIAPFSILADTCSNKTLAKNGTCSVSIRFSPTIQAVFADKVSIPSNDPDGTVTIGLSGEGYGLNVLIDKIEADEFCNVTVDVYVTSPLIDHRIDTLTDLDFLLFENGQAIPAIEQFQNLVPSPVSVVLAIDWSGSVIGVIDTIKAAASTFVDNLNPATDEAAACKFDGNIELDPPESGPLFFYTVDYSDLITYINNDFSGSTGTDLYDAVYQSIDRAVLGGNDKKAVVVLSDGVNEDSGDPTPDATLAQVIAHAIDEEVPVFTIYYRDPDYGGEDYGKPEVMEQLAEDTGGKYYDGTAVVDLAEVYQEISNILSGKYALTYESTFSAGNVSLEVLVGYLDPDEGPLYGQDSGTITFLP